MPDKFSEASEANLPSASDLDAVAREEQIKRQSSVGPPTTSSDKCFLCDKTPQSFCRHCGQEFCKDHASKYNPQLCCKCLTEDNIRTESEPIVDEDGTGHEGRRIKLIGEGWPYNLELLVHLNDEELKSKIATWQELLQTAIRTGDFARIMIAAAQFEQGEREHSRRRRLMRRREELKQGVLRVGGKAHRVSAKSEGEVEKLARTLNISVEQAKLVMQALGKK